MLVSAEVDNGLPIYEDTVPLQPGQRIAHDRVVKRIGIVFALIAVCGCADHQPPPRPNVVVIVVDTLRADRLPFYGSPHNTAPFLTDLARRSLVFESAWSPSSWTLPATVSAVTSVHPFQHGVNNLDGLELGPGDKAVPVNYIPEELETLAEVMGAAGYRTYGIVSNVLVGPEIGFERGFDRFFRLEDKDADRVNALVRTFQEEMLNNGPFFLYLHYFDPHDPFHAREPWFDLESSTSAAGWPEEISVGPDISEDLGWIMTRLEPGPEEFEGRNAEDLSPDEIHRLLAWIKAAYDSEIGFVDSRIREVFEMLDLDDAVVVFYSDHGEEFYEHGDLTHGQNLYAETVRVPFLLYLPQDGAPRGRVEEHVSTLDILPTLRGLLRLPPSNQDQGQDLLGDAPRRPVLGILEGKSGQHPLEDDLRSIVVGAHRLIGTRDGEVELYDIVRDPLELNDIADAFPDVVTELLHALDRVERSVPKYPRAMRLPERPNEALRKHLQGLGYLGNK